MEIIKNAKNGVAFKFAVPLIDAANRPDYKASPTLAAGDVKVARYTGAAWSVANITSLPTAITGMTTHLEVSLTASEMTADDDSRPIIITFIDQTATKEWDDQTAEIRLGAGESDVVRINGGLTSGYNATLKLKMLDIQNNDGHGISAVSTGTNKEGIYAKGSGTGAGFYGEGGPTGAGMELVGGISSGTGLRAYAQGSSGSGAAIVGIGASDGLFVKGGPTGHGANFEGGASGGDGLRCRSLANNDHGIEADGNGAGNGAYFTGGNAGGDGLHVQAGSGGGTGHHAVGGGTGGAGMTVNSFNDGHGLQITGKGSGNNAIDLTSHSAGKDLDAKEIGVPVTVDGGPASLAGMLLKMIDDNNGADFDATTDSLEKIATTLGNVIRLDSTVDGKTVTNILEKIMSMADGRFAKNVPSPGQITFYKRDNSTPLFIIEVTTAGRNRISG